MSVAQLAVPQTVPSAAVTCWQPNVASQVSVVQALLSLQFSVPVPAWQALLAQTSPVVQALPSSQSALFAACRQPDAGSQLSFVQTLPSLHTGAAPPTHLLLAHVSLVVQALPSPHASVLAVKMQPAIGSHVSVVQGLLSLQVTAVGPVHTLLAHTSLVVQALPSEQTDVLAAFTQPVAELQESSVHTLLSLQDFNVPAQAPDWQVSPVVHALLSSHAAELLACKQP